MKTLTCFNPVCTIVYGGRSTADELCTDMNVVQRCGALRIAGGRK